jgi:sugar-specific transcriptional regulator TrmB
MRESEILKSLEKLSLSRHEACVYLELLKLGATNAGPIVKNTKLHRQVVYGALGSLEDSHLVSVMVQNNRKVFQACPPDTLLRRQEERERLAQEIMPALNSLMPQNQDRLAVQVFYGKQEFLKNLFTVLAAAAQGDRIVRIIGGGSDSAFYGSLGAQYQDYLEEAKRLGVVKYLIAPATEAGHFKERFAKEPGNILKLQHQGLSSPTYTRITPELTTVEIYASEIMVIQIWNRAVARGYLEHFNLLWASARPY